MQKEPLNPTNLRANLYKIIDEIIKTGEPVEVLRNGHKIKLELDASSKDKTKKFLDKLKRRPNFINANTDEELINVPHEWNHDFS